MDDAKVEKFRKAAGVQLDEAVSLMEPDKVKELLQLYKASL